MTIDFRARALRVAVPVFAASMLAFGGGGASAQEPLVNEQVISLWNGRPAGTPDTLEPYIVERSKDLFRADRALMGIADPSLTVILPEHPNGTSLIVAPGGSYRRVVLDKEGIEIGKVLANEGVTTFLLAYRLPGEGHEAGPDVTLADGQRAVRLVRAHAEEWGLEPDRIGILGFSAAGHLAASVATAYDREAYAPVDAADSLSARPDFTVLVYPVVTMEDPYAHAGSREALLGKEPTAEDEALYSPERHVTAQTPQTFMVLADNDPSVPSQNAIDFYLALHQAGVPAELHVFSDGRHGFGIRKAADQGMPVAGWPALLGDWMRYNHFIVEDTE
ncbi:alpha/beta hydrolase [Martelella mangrovi]|uniref:Acetyl esterase/lipase n=1 Tax=Martelella mangrovi TaxID=1397477 RepID=A0ABV2IFC0_9HYPH